MRRGIWNLLFDSSLLKKFSDSGSGFGGGRSSIDRGGCVDDTELDSEGEGEWLSIGSWFHR
jgi:hypothetical protein